jgi:hypothetical protein
MKLISSWSYENFLRFVKMLIVVHQILLKMAILQLILFTLKLFSFFAQTMLAFLRERVRTTIQYYLTCPLSRHLLWDLLFSELLTILILMTSNYLKLVLLKVCWNIKLHFNSAVGAYDRENSF